MTFITGSYPLLIGGVSEQSPAQRLPNQVTKQVNMLSDPVTGLRRRNGAEVLGSAELNSAPAGVKTQLVRLAARDYMVVVALGSSPQVLIYEVNPWQQVANYTSGLAYLTGTTDPDDIQVAVHADAVYILNRKVTVTETAKPAVRPRNQGCAQILYGAFYVEYTLRVNHNGGSFTTFKHSVNGVVGDKPETADKITPEAIATALAAKITAGGTYTASVDGDCIVISTSAGRVLGVTTSNNSSYVMTTGIGMSVGNTGALVSRLPTSFTSNHVMQVGYDKATAYFRYNHDLTAWVETVQPEDKVTLMNLPLRVALNTATGAWGSLTSMQGMQREAGDQESNPRPPIVGKQVTCIGSFQGRLMLCAGSVLLFSSSDKENRWYRRTVLSLRDDDPVSFESSVSAARGALYREAVMFGGNMLLLGDGTQAVVQGANVLTPTTANIQVVSQHEITKNIPHIMLGRSMLFINNQQQRHNVWELFAGEFGVSGITADNITGHLPNYITTGDAVQIHASDTAGTAVITCGTERIVLYQYLWENADKLFSGFHEWVLPVPIQSAYVVENYVLLLSVADNVLQAYKVSLDLETAPKLDFVETVQADSSNLTVTAVHAVQAAALRDNTYWVKLPTGEYYQPVWTEDNGVFTAPQQVPVQGDFVGGIGFESLLQPTHPVIRDRYNQPILLQRAVLHSLSIQVNNSGMFTLTASDSGRPEYTQELNPVKLYTWDILQGVPQSASVDVQAMLRIDLNTAKLVFRSNTPSEFNIAALEYSYRHTQRFQRAFTGE